jgi:hypothetical protein
MQREFTNQMQRLAARVATAAHRLAGALQTELLFDLGWQAVVASPTSAEPRAARAACASAAPTFCSAHRRSPDLLIGNREENYREGIERLVTTTPWMSDIRTWTRRSR